MYTYGKKCPSCNERDLHPAAPINTWLSRIPTCKRFICPKCHLGILYIFPFSIIKEQRSHQRHALPKNFLLRISGAVNSFARIRDISTEGVCFMHNYHNGGIPEPFYIVDLYNCDDGTSLEGLHVKMVDTSEELHAVGETAVFNTYHRGRFTNLNQVQKKVLASCIEKFK